MMKIIKQWKISSGLPRAKGIIESINRTPVCNGSNSDCLPIIPGAGDWTTQRYCTSILPSFKIRLPSGSRMEPIAKSPNRIEANQI